MRTVIRQAVSIMAIVALLAGALITAPAETAADAGLGTSYYVDSVGGNDDNAGTSPHTAWKTLESVNEVAAFQPGDRILLKAGSIWTGMLNPKGSGADGSPIVVDMYGTGNKPIINGAGIEYPDAPLRLGNQSYWEIRNLEITNNDYEEGYRAAVLVRSDNLQVNRHLVFSGLNIHDVRGDNHFGAGKSTGGIIIDALGSIGTRYDDVRVEGSTFTTVDRTGINIGWVDETLSGQTGSPNYHTNIVVRNNTLSDIGGDGIMVMHAKAPLVEYNVSQSGNVRASLKSPADGFSVAMWPWSTDDAVFQFNEVYGEKWNEAQYRVYGGFGEDGTAFDVDGFNFRSIHQYNYSHDNQGGFMMVCGNADVYSDTSIIRYNISQNDGDDLFDINGPNLNTYIYNNVFYTKEGMNVKPYHFRGNGGYSDNTQSYNNIFYNLGTGDNVWGEATNVVFDYNAFYGHHSATEPNDPHKITADPMLVNPGSGTTGLDSLEGYKLLEGSPLIDAGMPIGQLGGIDNGGQDFWGHALYNGAPDIGAYEFTTSNLLVNPGFETGDPTGWSSAAGTAAVIGGGSARSGNYAIQASAGGDIAQSVSGSVYDSRAYTLSAWVKTETGAVGTIGVNAYDSSNAPLATALIEMSASNASAYEKVEQAFTAPAGTARLEIYFKAAGGAAYADDFSLEAGNPVGQPPAVPMGLTAVADSSSQIRVSWQTVAGAASYDLMVDGMEIGQVYSPYTHAGLSPGSSHTYRVRAVNGDGVGAWSPTVSAVTPAAATNLVGNAGFEASALADWGIWGGTPTVVADTPSVKIAHGGVQALHLADGASVYQDIASNVIADKHYTFSFWANNPEDEAWIGISCLDQAGNGIDGCGLDFTLDVGEGYKPYVGTLRTLPGVKTLQIYAVAGASVYLDDVLLERSPPVPSGVSTIPAGGSRIDVVWAAVEGAMGYDILIDDQLITDVSSPYAHTGLEEGETHTYRIRSKHGGGASAWTPSVSASLTEQSNLLTNPGFEAGTTGWEVSWGAEVVAGIGYNGAYGLRGDGWDGRSQMVSKGVEGDKTYLVSLWGKVSAIEAGKPDAGKPGLGTIDVVFYDGNNVMLQGHATPISVTSETFQHYTGSFVTPPGTAKMEFSFQANDQGVFVADDIVLEASVPAGLKAAPVSETQIQVTWNDVTGATEYDLLVDGTLASNVTSPYQHQGLAEGSAHTYQVRATRSDTGTSTWSAPITAVAQKSIVNLLPNPGFEKGDMSGWNHDAPDNEIYGDVTVVKDEVRSGLFALRSGAASGFLHTGITGFTPGQSYTLLVWAKAVDGAVGYIGVNCIDSEGKKIKDGVVELAVTNADYKQLGGKFTIPAGTASLQLYLTATGKGAIYADDFMLTKTQPSFTIVAAGLDRSFGIQAAASIKPTSGAIDHSGKETVVFQLMDGDVPVSIVSLIEDIQTTKELTAEFHVADPQKPSYRVKVFVFDRLGSSAGAAENLAAPRTME
ncbi:hypothetical protein B1A99_25865 [Cohnella sp. CIP 111063]|uniref:carbohydrate binding domain-containing protein n=1 Tax=unclassified Cohnella TaxID=2636738 RepID=UPI000B8C0DBA|nr:MULTISPECIES: carbohydrate binding domain-containing protein [unclassified Cohnella]OXS54755.1 hypothetical protein B1A99_25865 [Cohnella sp. CIP 111063]PRX64592.1 carbohydrate binding protein [Cohnella sp. SGD-V74]